MRRLQINPPIIELFPNDEREFTAESVPPPPLWHSVTNGGDIQPDLSLIVDGAQSSVAGAGGHKLFGGSGRVELKIDNQCLPTSGVLRLTGDISDISAFVYQYKIEISATTVVVKNEANTTIFSESHTVLSGEVYQLELNAGFRLYRNGVELHKRVELPTQVLYPMSYSVELVEDVTTNPARIPPSRLIGDGWRLGNVVTWTAPAHGVLSTTGPGLTTKYSGGKIPGRYTLTVQVEPTADGFSAQKATATIDIPALEILGESTLTVDPDRKVKIKTNYDEAQNSLVALSILSGGGSLSGSEFTTGSAPGTTVVRATAAVNGQAANVSIIVPAVVTPDVDAAAPGDPVDFVTNLTAPAWSATLGQIFPSGLWIAPDLIGQTARITASSGGTSVTRKIEIVEKFPTTKFKLPWPIDYAKRVLVSEAEDGTRTSRIKIGARRGFPVEWFVDTTADLGIVREFWDRHHPGVRFILEDPEEQIRFAAYTDSELRWEHTESGVINIAGRVKQQK